LLKGKLKAQTRITALHIPKHMLKHLLIFLLIPLLGCYESTNNNEEVIKITKFPYSYHGSWVEIKDKPNSTGYDEITIDETTLTRKWYNSDKRILPIEMDWAPLSMEKITVKNIKADINYCLKLNYEHGSEAYILSGYNNFLKSYDTLTIKHINIPNSEDSKYVKIKFNSQP
jgi:hypothetical protein